MHIPEAHFSKQLTEKTGQVREIKTCSFGVTAMGCVYPCSVRTRHAAKTQRRPEDKEGLDHGLTPR